MNFIQCPACKQKVPFYAIVCPACGRNIELSDRIKRRGIALILLIPSISIVIVIGLLKIFNIF